ncbi:unnamed protein product [[Candida] boidinii]|uniref:Unnamed protein product n=1 Tax=Candida boidinii TaxID=5477 RepID=A0ACB5TQZ0_CANBO|nr:unnamed protein product [[Candida] boidinii]
MRESNYKVVSANKAAVSITSTLYDRRALDCSEDKPLINSLNHLTFLASSSGKVREALASDGGLERLIVILHECKNPKNVKEQCLAAWKWILAFQCLVLVGTRGTEKIRKRVVEAGIIPVIATILDNYILSTKNNNKQLILIILLQQQQPLQQVQHLHLHLLHQIKQQIKIFRKYSEIQEC